MVHVKQLNLAVFVYLQTEQLFSHPVFAQAFTYSYSRHKFTTYAVIQEVKEANGFADSFLQGTKW
jgi:hypothetical protein